MAEARDRDVSPTPSPEPPIQLDYRTRVAHKPIAFVPAQSGQSAVTPNKPGKAIGDGYLALVLSQTSSSYQRDSAVESATPANEVVCDICKLPLTSNTSSNPHHESSLAHQLCLRHTHPPSALDRSRKGLAYLQSYGWDPDARKGLGTSSEGILYPIKAKEKKDNAGIGAVAMKEKKITEKVQKLGPKQIKEMEKSNKKKAERLHRIFYGNGELEKYLGPEA